MTDKRLQEVKSFREKFPMAVMFITFEGAVYRVRKIHEYFFRCYIPGERPDKKYTIPFDLIDDLDIKFK